MLWGATVLVAASILRRWMVVCGMAVVVILKAYMAATNAVVSLVQSRPSAVSLPRSYLHLRRLYPNQLKLFLSSHLYLSS
jgi:hypothetical protein